jgi:hypothetical protein
LGVGAVTEGTRRLKHEHALEPGITAARAKAHEQSRDGEADAARRAKIAQAKRGKPRPAPVIEAIRQGRTGKPHNEAVLSAITCEKSGQSGQGWMSAELSALGRAAGDRGATTLQ